MILEEFDLTKQLALERKDGYAKGRAEGHAEGQEVERNRFSELTKCLIADSRSDEIAKAAMDSEFCLRLYREYHIE